MTFVTIATMHPAEGKRDAVYEVLKPEEKFVYDNEGDFNSAYFFSSSLESNDIIGIEIYNTKDDLLNKHMKSPGFEVFAAGAVPLFAKPFDLADYEPANIGFLTRPGVGREFIKDSIVLSVEFELKPGTRDRFLADAEVLAADVLANEPNCLSYYYMKSLDNPDKVGIFERQVSFFRYKTRHDIDVVHRGAEVFKKIFGGFEKDGILVKKSIIECTDSGVGFLERA